MDYAVGMLATACKLDERQIRATTVAHFRRLERYWAKNPPEHVIGRAFVKIKESPAELDQAAKISPDARPEAERRADERRVASLRRTRRGPEGLERLVAAAKGGEVSLEALFGRAG